MKTELETAYIVIESPDPAAIDHYFGQVVGLMPGDSPAPGTSAWRVDDRAQRVLVQAGPRRDAVCIGFEAVDETAFAATLARLQSLDVETQAGSAADCAQRRVRKLARVSAPWGVEVEICLGLAAAHTPFTSPPYPDGFVTQGQGFGHFVFTIGNAAEYDAARRFAIDGLGLKLSDWLRMPVGNTELHVSFLHCNARHHSMALAFMPMPQVPQRLHHVNFEVRDVPPVGLAFERALQAGVPIANTIGQHDNDSMVSFYSTSPDGWRVEVGATGRTIDDGWTDVREYHRISKWGHQPPEMLMQMQAASGDNQ